MARPPKIPPVSTQNGIPRIKTSAVRRPKKRSRLPVWTAAFLFLACVIAMAMVIDRSTRPEQRPPELPAPQTASVRSASPAEASAANSPTAEASEPPANPYQTVEDDGVTLWVPPTFGDPISLECLPQGTKCIVHVNLASLWASEEGRRVIKAVGPGVARSVAAWERSMGTSASQMDSVTFAWVPQSSGKPRLLIRLLPNTDWRVPADWKPVSDATDGRATDSVVPSLSSVPHDRGEERTGEGSEAPAATHSQRYQAGGRDIIIFTGTDRWLIMGSAELLEEFSEGSIAHFPVLQRQLETLREKSDRQRNFSLLATANFLWTHGTDAFGSFEVVLDTLEYQLGGRLEAASFSSHVEDGVDCYAELQSVWQPEVTHAGAEHLRRRLTDALAATRKYSQSLELESVDPYWSDLHRRVPRMLAAVGRQLRVQREGHLVIANVSLPPEAAHNLTLIGEFLLPLRPLKSPLRAQTDREIPPMVELLQQTITYEFGQRSLVEALQGLEYEVRRSVEGAEGFSIEVDGPALRAEGITRNQQIADFHYRNASIGTVLTAIVKQGNPIKVALTTDPGQKLVWVAQPGEPKANSTVILITTRRAVEDRTLDLPDDFANP